MTAAPMTIVVRHADGGGYVVAVSPSTPEGPAAEWSSSWCKDRGLVADTIEQIAEDIRRDDE